MDFSQVTRAHVERALERLRAGEEVVGYGASTDYDLVVNGEKFAPKQAMALASQEATGIVPPEVCFLANPGSPCFLKLEQLGFSIRAHGFCNDLRIDNEVFALLGDNRVKGQRMAHLSVEQQAMLANTHRELEVFARDFVARHWSEIPLSFHLNQPFGPDGCVADKLCVAFYGERNPLHRMSLQFLVQLDGDGVQVGISMGELVQCGTEEFALRHIHNELTAMMKSMPAEVLQVLAENITPGYTMFLDGDRQRPANSLEEWFFEAGLSPFARITRSLSPNFQDAKTSGVHAIGQSPEPLSFFAAIECAFELFLPTLRYLTTAIYDPITTRWPWIFQVNPNIFRINEYLDSRPEFYWPVNDNAELIKRGDRVFIWRAAVDSGVVGVAEIVSDITELPCELSEYWLIKPKTLSGRGVRLRMLDCRVFRPLLRDTIRRHIPDLNVLRLPNATNIHISPEEAARLDKLLKG